MKIAFNPSTVAALITPPNNKDITFDLRGRNIFARGVKFCGTDTWRDIKINNVSIGSNILDLRNGSNTTLTNTNGVVTINSTWRPVVDNLTSDSTTSSLSANLGRVLAGLINGHPLIIDMRNYDESYWHPVTVELPRRGYNKIKVSVLLNIYDKPSWATHNAGFTCNMEIWATAHGWGTTSAETICLNYTYAYCNSNPCGWMLLGYQSLGVLFLRGGSRYKVYTDFDATFTPHDKTYTWIDGSYSLSTGGPYTSCPGLNFNKNKIYANLDGYASSAIKLQTPRTIWGQSFDGTANVSGSLSGVGHIQFSADHTYDIGSNNAASRNIYTYWLGAKSGLKLELGANNSSLGLGLCIDTNLNVGIGTNTPAYKLDVVGNIRATGQIIREGSSLTWVNGRKGALLRETTSTGYHTLWSLKTTNGSWDFGEYNSSGWNNIPVLSYITDTNFNSGNNTTTYQIKFPLDNGTIALTKNIPTSLPANGGNADTVDGYHASSLWRSDGATWNPGANVSLTASGNNQEWSFDIRRNGYTGCCWHVWDSDRGSILKVNADNGKVYAPYNFVGNLEGNASTATALTTNAGNSINPIYFSGGKPIACTMSTGRGNGIVRSFSRGTYKSANLYFGNGTIVAIDPIGTGCISANDTILSLGDLAERNTQLLVAYDRDGVYYRRITDNLNYGNWKRLAFTTDNVASATKVIVNLHTANDTNYPLVWSNLNNTNTVTENQLYKSWSDLYYNPKNKRLTVGGSIYAAHFYESSDKTLKKNIKSILSSTNIPKIREFDWKDTGEHSYGFIALELEELGYGCLVSEVNGKKIVNYTATLALTVAKLLNLINIQNKKISNLTKELKSLKYGRKKNS